MACDVDCRHSATLPGRFSGAGIQELRVLHLMRCFEGPGPAGRCPVTETSGTAGAAGEINASVLQKEKAPQAVCVNSLLLV
jgi:hypothetical protein